MLKSTSALASRALAVLAVVFVSGLGAAEASPPPCLARGVAAPLPIDDQRVIDFKRNTKAQFQARARVSGTVTRVTLIRPTHDQFEIQLGPNKTDTIEVIYNVEFGALPTIQPGMQVEACGDYITVNNSPSGAIIHWVHYNPGDRDGGRHEDGYVMIDGVVYGGRPGSQRASFSFFQMGEGWIPDAGMAAATP